MLGYRIFVHAVRMVFGNFKELLRIALVPLLIAAVLFGATLFMGLPWEMMEQGEQDIAPEEIGSFMLVLIASLLIFSVTFFWIAVSWHRFILLEEVPDGWVPVFRKDRIAAYFWRFVLIALLGMALFLPASFILLGFLQAVPLIGYVLLAAGSVVLLVVITRLSITLPAAALGKPIGFGDAWQRTKGSGMTISVMLVVSSVFQLLVQLVVFLFSFIPVVGFIVALFLGSFVTPMINLSILTTLYGYFVEKRALN